MTQPTPLFDGHLDLAYLTGIGRDMHAGLSQCLGTLLPASVTLPALRAGNVQGCLGTIFTEPGTHDSPSGLQLGGFGHTYPPGDAEAAHRAGLRQLKLYHAWRDAGVIDLLPNAGTAPLAVGILMEGADPISNASEVAWWASQGVVAIGLAWATGSRYAGGNTQTHGLTDEGKDMVRAIDEAGLFHDLSHLSDKATDQLLELTTGRVFASHSNARSLLGGQNQRHLRDETIAEIARRGGIVGINLYAPFLDPTFEKGKKRPPLRKALDHVLHVANVAGKDHVGLGTDMDGGFDANSLPEGIHKPADLHTVLDLLSEQGWSEREVIGFAYNNWARVLGLPPAP
ncbi:MAG: membrane dipeptidase [Phycisphaeraceae bacterium]|nr:membrane dipeptidase [Phycisphaeraceae bacterium]